ncbi:hypothetical protein BC830DRAFT_1110414 [Chytriomyces sp. MP71]|nr:hypothetical protein BC830DRAFT_1110414 [Chytriomyces sp. MP71]
MDRNPTVGGLSGSSPDASSGARALVATPLLANGSGSSSSGNVPLSLSTATRSMSNPVPGVSSGVGTPGVGANGAVNGRVRVSQTGGGGGVVVALGGRAELHGLQVIHAEISGVVSTMRKNARWALSGDGNSYYRDRDLPRGHGHASTSNGDYEAVATAVPTDHADAKRLRRRSIISAEYDYCADLARHGSASAHAPALDALLDFTAQANARYGHRRPLPASTADPLLAGFARLKARLTLIHELRDLEPIHLLAPFLEVIKSGDTTGPITGAALSSVEKFIKYKVLDPNHPSLPHAMSVLTHTVSNCKFEATDAVSDEVVLTKILRLIRVTVMSEAGQKTLDDKAICEMVETAFGMCFQGRVSELLKRSAEQTLIVLVQVLFERLSQILKAKEHSDRLKALLISSDDTEKSGTTRGTTNVSLSSPAAAVTSNIMRSLKTRQKNEPETVFASSKGEAAASDSNSGMDGTIAAAGGPGSGLGSKEDGSGDVLLFGPDNDNAIPMISIADGAGVVSSNEPGMITVGSQDSDAELKDDDLVVGSGDDSASGNASKKEASDVPAATGNRVHFEDTVLATGAVTVLAMTTEYPVKEESGEGKMEAPVASPIVEGTSQQQQQPHHRIFAPFGLPAILELIRVLVTLMDPRNRNHTDTAHRLIALTLLNVGIEVGGRSLGRWIGWGYEVEGMRTNLGDAGISDEEKMALAAKELIVNELIKYLFQLLQNLNMTFNSPPSSNNMTLLSLTLRILSSLFQTSRHYLKFQFEYFLDWIMTKVNSGVVGWDVGDASNEGVLSMANNDPDRPSSVASITSRASVVSPTSSGSLNGAGRNVLVAEARELLLETMVQCCRIPGFFTELWVNFDGDSQCHGNLYEEVVRFLSKHTFPDATPGGPVTTSNHQVLCVDGLLLLLRHIAERKSGVEVGMATVGLPESLYRELSPNELLAVKLRKRLLSEAAERFNVSPKEGIRFLQEHQLLPSPADPKSIAVFLKTTPSVNKKLIGEYIAKRGNEDILKTFISLYNFKGKRLDEGLRLLLESFRLPGEAQLIERVVENFAEGYFHAMEDTQDHHIADQSSAFVLAFSIILLNTDQHNPQVRRRMTREDFQRNNRGCNNGKDFDPEYLGAIYEAIKSNEIVMPEEHEGDLGFNYAWRELMKRASAMNPLMTSPRGSFSKDMFAVICDPTVAAISYAFDSSEDTLTLQKAIVGFHRCAAIANMYQMSEVLDNIVIRLSKTTGLLKDSGKLPPEHNGDEDPLDKEKTHRVDPWAVEFGRNYKSQVATVLMFSLAAEYGNTLRDGWKNIMDVLGNLFLHSLLQSSLLTTDNFIRKNVFIPRLQAPEKPAAPTKKETGGTSLFFSLTQLLSLSSQDDDYEQPPSPEELEAEKNALACIVSCRVEELFFDTRFLEEASLKHILSILVNACYHPNKLASRSSQVSLFPADGEKAGTPVMQDAVAAKPVTATTDGSADRSLGKYSISVAFYLELMVSITFHNRDRLRVVWPVAFDLISRILSDGCPEYPPLLERAVVGLLRLLTRMVHKDDMLSQVFQAIDMLTTLPQETLNNVSEQLTAGMLQLIKTDPTLMTRYPKGERVLHLLAATSMHQEASRYSLEAASLLVGDSANSLVTGDNFGDCVDLLLSFATSAGGIILAAENGILNKTMASPRTPISQKSVNALAASERAIKSLDRVFAFHSKIPGMVTSAGVGREKAWFVFWLPVLSGLAQQCYNPGREIRQHSLTLLQRTLLSPELEATVMTPKANPATGEVDAITTSTLETGVDVFESVLFPLLFELLKPEVSQLDSSGMDETRMRVAGLLCKIFLQYLNRLLRFKELPILWIKVLDFMNQYVNAGGSEFVSEGVLESLKNMLLVMSTQRVFEAAEEAPTGSPVGPGSHNLWVITWQHIGSAYPGLQDELFPGVGTPNGKPAEKKV